MKAPILYISLFTTEYLGTTHTNYQSASIQMILDYLHLCAFHAASP